MSEVDFGAINKSRIGLNFVFASMGLAAMSAATRLADIKEAVGVGDSVFGYALAAGTIGGLTGNFFSHRIIHWFGNNFVIRVAGLLMMTSVAMQSQANSAIFLGFCTAFAALGYSIMNVAVNAAGVEVELALKRSVMPMFHASWSIGALTTSLIGNFVAGVSAPTTHLFAIWTIAVLGLFFAIQQVTDPNKDLPKPDRKSPIPWEVRKVLIGISFATALGMVAESSAYHWSAIYFHEVIGMPIGPNTLGLTAFLVAQIVGRLVTGKLNDRFGIYLVIRFSATSGAIAYFLMLILNVYFLQNPDYQGSTLALIISMFGFACVGLGVAALPAGYMAGAGRVSGVSPTRAIANVAVLNTSLAMVFQPILSTLIGSIGLSFALVFAAIALFASGYQSKVLAPLATN